jgi:hypothetical protein
MRLEVIRLVHVGSEINLYTLHCKV